MSLFSLGFCQNKSTVIEQNSSQSFLLFDGGYPFLVSYLKIIFAMQLK